jgi:hypothetical protein
MWIQRAATLCGCLAALPLLMGCANGVGGPSRAYTPPAPLASVPAAPDMGARVFAAGPGAPAAILVMLPGPGDMLTADPRSWAAQGFDVVTPPPEVFPITADQPEAARLIAQAQALADAPVWLVGPNPAIAAAMAAMPPGGAGRVSGLVVTSTISGAGTCSERVIYSYAGNGAAPKVAVSKSGDACATGPAFGGDTNPAAAPPTPAVQPHAPQLIEASAGPAAAPAARRATVERVAEAIKSAPPS